MKRIDIFCASQAATAIRLSMDEASSSSSSSAANRGGGKEIDRHNPIIRDPKRFTKSLPPCSSEPPSKPRRKSSSKKTPIKSSNYGDRKNAEKKGDIFGRKSWSCTRPGEFFSPPGSSRYLLGDNGSSDAVPEFDPVWALVPVEAPQAQVVKKDKSSAPKPATISSSPDQVVVLRVSLHCRGCERKMRKHISRMEGVTSFNIDFAAKKVTIIGDVTPLGILASVSKVKNAQLWAPTLSSSPSSSSLVPGCSEVKKYKEVVSFGRREKIENVYQEDQAKMK